MCIDTSCQIFNFSCDENNFFYYIIKKKNIKNILNRRNNHKNKCSP